MADHTLNQAPLGKKSIYKTQYDPTLLVGVPRALNRSELLIGESLPFFGVDLWNAYELSWLNQKGKPQVAIARFEFECQSSHLVESKSFKLYLNSLNNTVFDDANQVQQLLTQDLTQCVGDPVNVSVELVDQALCAHVGVLAGECIDHFDVECAFDQVNPSYLRVGDPGVVEQTYVSHLLKSNCLVTGQPDWGSVQIQYSGPQIDPGSLLQYLVSYRNHNEFHEHCVERIFMDILEHCRPTDLSVYARYTRRGGLDINPFRSTRKQFALDNQRLVRQ